MAQLKKTDDQLKAELMKLQSRLMEAEETLRAIRGDEVDALVVATNEGDKVFTLTGAEHPYRVMVETMYEGAITLAVDGTILYANKRFVEILQGTLEQILGATFYDFLSPKELHSIKKLIELEPRRGQQIESTLYSIAGNTIPVLLAISSYHHEDVPGTLCMVVTDLSEQKRNLELLAEERLVNQILDLAEELYVICDHRGFIIRASQSTAHLFGRSLIFKKFDEEFLLFYPDGTPFEILTALEDMAIHTFEVVFKPGDGVAITFLLSAKALSHNSGILGIVVVMVNITGRKRIEEVLKASEIRYRRLFETARDGIIILEAETGIVEDVNPFMLDLTGFTRTFFIGKELWNLGVFKEVERLKAGLSTRRAENLLYHDEIELLTKGGQVLIVELGSTAYKVEQHLVIQINLRDITARKLVEDALQHSHDKLEQRVDERTVELNEALHKIRHLKDQLEAENIYLRHERKTILHHDRILGQSESLMTVLFQAEQVAPTNATVLILGETGTGKELIANIIHDMSPRKSRPLIMVNCATLPTNLIESELFGREKGAFTGADTRQLGRFEIANGSSLCLDEIGELPLEMQSKLLRAIQHNEFERLGSSHTIKVDVRIIATTNRNLEEEVRKGTFRQDLFYRLNVFPITVPPLRMRKDDIPQMIEVFVERFARKLGKKITSIQKESMNRLQNYSWPGNVRELESVIERAVILCAGTVLQLTDELDRFPDLVSDNNPQTLEEVERNQILKCLSEANWRIEGKKGAAEILGLHPSTLRARMHKLEIRRPTTGSSD